MAKRIKVLLKIKHMKLKQFDFVDHSDEAISKKI